MHWKQVIHTGKINIQLFADFTDSALDHNWIENRKISGRLNVEMIDIPALGYNSNIPDNFEEFENRATQLADEVFEKLNLESADENSPYILHVHNLSLGKNPLYSRAFTIIAKRAQEKSLALALVSQIQRFCRDQPS